MAEHSLGNARLTRHRNVELHACGDKIYKRPTKVHGIVSGQMPPIKPTPP